MLLRSGVWKRVGSYYLRWYLVDLTGSELSLGSCRLNYLLLRSCCRLTARRFAGRRLSVWLLSLACLLATCWALRWGGAGRSLCGLLGSGAGHRGRCGLLLGCWLCLRCGISFNYLWCCWCSGSWLHSQTQILYMRQSLLPLQKSNSCNFLFKYNRFTLLNHAGGINWDLVGHFDISAAGRLRQKN